MAGYREPEGLQWRKGQRVQGQEGTVFRWPVAGTPHAGNMQIAWLKCARTMTEARTLVKLDGEGAREGKDRMYVTIHVGFDQV